MRIFFAGSPPFGLPSFQALLECEHQVVGLLTPPAGRAGRGLAEATNPLVPLAEDAGVPVLRPANASGEETLTALADLQPDLGMVVSYGQILSPEFLSLPAQGCVNLHGSLLPRWRGASPVQAAILAGDLETGVCLQRVVSELDAGPVLARKAVAIAERETGPGLQDVLAAEGAELLKKFLATLGQGEVPPGDEQDHTEATHCRKVKKEDGRIDWSNSSGRIDRQVRAYSGWPWAQAGFPGGQGVRVLRGRVDAGLLGAHPGVILAVGESIEVACGEGSFHIDELQRPGKRALNAAEFLRGFLLEEGAQLQ